MDDGLFRSEMSQFDFEMPARPDEVPRLHVSGAGGDTSRSQVVESLISQNEDLMARLKVNLRRLHFIEEENQQLKSASTESSAQLVSMSDQLSIWREKERIWKNKNQEMQDQLEQIRKRFPDLEKMEDKIIRHERYQERIKNQVKPYIQQLKTYSGQLAAQIQAMHQELDVKDSEMNQMKRAQQQREQDWAAELHSQQVLQIELTQKYETDMEAARQNQGILIDQNRELQEINHRNNQIILKLDETENQLIAVTRQLQESETHHHSEHEKQRAEAKQLRDQCTIQKIKIAELEQTLLSRNEEIKSLASRKIEIEEKLTSLRFLWTQQSQELDRLKLGHQALEKLNTELSLQLNELRYKLSPSRT